MVSGRVWEFQKLLLEDLGSSWGLSKLPKSRFIGPVSVWEAHNSRSAVPVGVWRPPGMFGSHDQSCLSVLGGLPGSYEADRPGFDGVSADLIVGGFGARPSKIFRSLEMLPL